DLGRHAKARIVAAVAGIAADEARRRAHHHQPGHRVGPGGGGAQREHAAQRPAQPGRHGHPRGHRRDHRLRLQRHGAVAAAAVPRQVDHVELEVRLQALGQRREHASVHGPAVQQHQRRTGAADLDVQVGAHPATRVGRRGWVLGGTGGMADNPGAHGVRVDREVWKAPRTLSTCAGPAGLTAAPPRRCEPITSCSAGPDIVAARSGAPGRRRTGRRMNQAESPLSLADPSLLRRRALVGGDWIDADGGACVDVVNPASGARLGTIPDMGAAETARAIDAARAAFPDWARTTAGERAALLRRLHDLLLEHQDDLARLMTAEQGKPLAEARGEIAYAAAYLDWFAGEAPRMYGDTIPGHAAGTRIMVLRQPVGVVAA